jgi:NAD(P) transhydrogenase subunit beta
MLPDYVVTLAYLLAAVLFVLGLKGLAHPRTAVRGNLTGACGMLIAVVVTLLYMKIVEPWVIIAGLIIGGTIGAILAIRIRMTAMPQLVGLLNGFGGGASVLVAGASFILGSGAGIDATQFNIAVAASGIIGAVTFWGSLVAFSKLQGLWFAKPVLFTGRHVVNAVLGAGALGLGAWLVVEPGPMWVYWALVGVASVLGVLLVIPIGGADMPVVITLLNSYSGLAACATGFVLSNNVLIIAGSLVGASGIILTRIMCRAMNRSLANVMFGTLGPAEGGASADEVYAGKVTSGDAEEVAMLFDAATWSGSWRHAARRSSSASIRSRAGCRAT